MNKRISPPRAQRVTPLRQTAPNGQLPTWAVKLGYRVSQLSQYDQVISFTLITHANGQRQLVVGGKLEDLNE